MASEIKEFDFKTCPFCGSQFDVKKDYYEHSKYRHRWYVFRCHACSTIYEVEPVVTAYQARVLERGESPSEDVTQFFNDREKRIEKARWKASES